MRTNPTRSAGASSGGFSWHPSSRVLHATPRAAATSRCVSPAANRDSAAAMCSAYSKRVRRVTTRSLARVAQRRCMVYSQAWQNLRTSFRILGEFAPPRVRNDEGSAKYPHTDYQTLGSDLAGITSKADFPEKALRGVEETSTQTGLRVTARILDKVYELGRKCSNRFREIRDQFICIDPVLGDWNYIVDANGVNGKYV
jgi:hypothetical protein